MTNILIIDDEPSILESLSMFLVEKGHTVYTADTGQKGLDFYINETPKIVIMDIRLPDLNGLDILETMVEKNMHQKLL